MDFILENLIWFIAAAAGFAQWLNAQREAKKERREQQTTPEEDYDFREELDEELERRNARPAVPPPIPMGAPSPAVPPPISRSRPAPAPSLQRSAPPREARQPSTRAGKELERQEQLAEKLQLLKEGKANRPSFHEASQKRRKTSPSGTGGTLKQRLTSRTELRTAFVLREILDKPVALKS
ncbi:MAG: hypothetical protein ACSHX7_10805 [Luteolibacter sp.]